MIVLDTNVISEIFRPQPAPQVVEWLESLTGDVAITTVTLAELAREPLILLDLGKSTNYFLSIFRDAHLTPCIHQRFESFEVVRSMVARGHGYTILNQRPAHNMTNDGFRIVRLPITDSRSLLQMGIAHRAEEPLSRKGEAFLEQCRQMLATPG